MNCIEYLYYRRVNLVALAALSLLMISSCKKKQAFKNEDGQVTVDNRVTQGENDEAIKDINIIIMEQFLLRGKTTSPYTATTTVCGVQLDTIGLLGGGLTLSFNGTECFGKIRTGTIKIRIVDYPLKKWKTQGSVLKIDFIGYKVMRTSDGRTIQLDGTQLLTNVSGGTWYDLWFLSEPSVTYDLTGTDFKATFSGDQNAIYNFNRRMTFTHSGEITRCSVIGLGSADGRNNLENWGQARDNAAFTTEIAEPVIWKTTCGAIAPVAGKVVIKVAGKDFDLNCKLGTDKNGNQLDENASDCPFGYELSWSYKRNTNYRVFGYY